MDHTYLKGRNLRVILNIEKHGKAALSVNYSRLKQLFDFNLCGEEETLVLENEEVIAKSLITKHQNSTGEMTDFNL